MVLALGVVTYTSASAHGIPTRDVGDSVFRVVAGSAFGTESSGSAVAIAPDKLATNCHVIRNARSIEIVQGARRWKAELHSGDAKRDVCILVAHDLNASPAIIGSTSRLKSGDRVSAIGYPGGGSRVITQGAIEALYRYGGAPVIQTSAPFDQGASGGALMSASGELVGILTFKAPSGGAFHFAVPVDWIAALERVGPAGHASPSGIPFYERDPKDRPHFLRAVWYQSKQKWTELFDVCGHWLSEDPDSDEATHLMIKTVDRLLHPHSTDSPQNSK